MEVQRTLVKSPPELWAEVSDVEALTRHLAAFGEITITRGLTDSRTVVDWLKTVMDGDLTGARKTAAVNILDHKGETIKTFNFTNCWVRSVEVNSLKAGSTEQATEKAIICFDESSVA